MAFNKAKALDEAAKLVSQRKIPQAIKLYLTVAEHDPNDLPLLNALGDLCVRDGNLLEALRQFHRLADAYSREGFILKAIAIYKKIVKLDPASVDPILKLADLYAGQKLSHEAHEQYKQALALCQRESARDKAGLILRKLVSLDPANTNYRARLAEYSKAAGRPREAVAGYLEAVSIAFNQKDLASARAALNSAAEIEPLNPRVAAWQAALAAHSGSLDEASRIFQDSPQILDALTSPDGLGEPVDPPALLETLGAALAELKQWSRAEAIYRRLLRQNAHHVEWQARLSECQEQQRTQQPLADSGISTESTDSHAAAMKPAPLPEASHSTAPGNSETESATMADAQAEPAPPVPSVDLSDDWESFMEKAHSAVPAPEPDAPVGSEPNSPSATEDPPREIAITTPEQPLPLPTDSLPVTPDAAAGSDAAGPMAGDSTSQAPWVRGNSAIDELSRRAEPDVAGLSETSTLLSAPASDQTSSLNLVFEELLSELSQEENEPAAPEDDPRTHYNLGVAFREMGLLDEAIGEFQKVVKGAKEVDERPRALEACSLLGVCFMEKRMPELAVRWLTRALRSPGLNEETILALTYDLGTAYEQSGDRRAALEKFSEVYSVNIDYRDVAERVQSLHAARA